jgi:hypothetical protein
VPVIEIRKGKGKEGLREMEGRRRRKVAALAGSKSCYSIG